MKIIKVSSLEKSSGLLNLTSVLISQLIGAMISDKELNVHSESQAKNILSKLSLSQIKQIAKDFYNINFYEK